MPGRGYAKALWKEGAGEEEELPADRGSEGMGYRGHQMYSHIKDVSLYLEGSGESQKVISRVRKHSPRRNRRSGVGTHLIDEDPRPTNKIGVTPSRHDGSSPCATATPDMQTEEAEGA